VASALLEAGFSDVAVSPRHLDNVLVIAERNWGRSAVNISESADNQPLLDWARSLLPWQDG
jgi:hypothetical protein